MGANAHHRREPRFFLAPGYRLGEGPGEGPGEGGPATLDPEELTHAIKVQRLAAGHGVVGLDGQGRAQRFVVTAVQRREVLLEPTGEVETQPRPGAPGSKLPHIQLAISLPRPSRVDPMVERLTQLGVAQLQPIVSLHSSSYALKIPPGRARKLDRAVREAMKQCERLWPMEIADPIPLADFLAQDPANPVLCLHPAAHEPLVAALGAWKPGIPVRLAIGPETGFDRRELEKQRLVGLQGHILRIETAAELAAGLASQILANTR